MRKLVTITLALFTLSLAACGGKGLSKDQCDKLVDKMIALQVGSGATPEAIEAGKKMAADEIKEFNDKCSKEVTQSQFDCAMKATTVDEFGKCDDK